MCCVQALFERAVAGKGWGQCALLWRAYIGFEAARSRPEAARRVFLRAIHACPWSKVGCGIRSTFAGMFASCFHVDEFCLLLGREQIGCIAL